MSHVTVIFDAFPNEGIATEALSTEFTACSRSVE